MPRGTGLFNRNERKNNNRHISRNDAKTQRLEKQHSELGAFASWREEYPNPRQNFRHQPRHRG
jgi:hypothetical protein